MGYYDEYVEFALEMITETGTPVTIRDLDSPSNIVGAGTVAVKIPSSAGETSSPNDIFGNMQDNSQTTKRTRLLITGTTIPEIKRDYTVNTGGQEYTIDTPTLLEPDFNSKIFWDCTVYES